MIWLTCHFARFFDPIARKARANYNQFMHYLSEIAGALLRRGRGAKRLYCHYPHSSLFVTMDGKVRPCCFSLPIGDLSQDIREIWNSPQAKNMRKSLLEGDMEKAGCSECGFIGRRDIETYPRDENLGQSDPIKKNIELQRKEYLKGRITLDSLPSHVVIQVTEACNYECVMCFQQHAAANIPDEYFRRALLYNDTYDEIQFTGGEPFLSKEVKAYLKNFDVESKAKLSFTTNGSLLHKFRDDIEKLPRLHLGVSVDAAREETYRKIRKGGGWAQLVENVEWIARLRRSRRPMWDTVRMAYVIMRSNYEEIPEFADWARRLEMPIMFAPVWGDFADNENIFKYPELMEGMTPPEEIISGVESTVKSMPDYEKSEILMSLRKSLGGLKQ